MSEIIVQNYEMIDKLGSGQGGVAYLANDLGLQKKVVLKADKREITTPLAILRREVDVLKNLNNPYIPQVYNFFIKEETAYTVMEYIAGESIDRPLNRKQSFSQPQVIKWAIQILNALVYLHSPIHGSPPRGFIHSDIKPSNLMLRPNGDICLIDFNVALAIGEQNFVGISIGYASPEHYGQDYRGWRDGEDTKFNNETIFMGYDTEQQSNDNMSKNISIRKIVPDARSDIYSLGATLYHLLSGNKPARYAVDVVPLSKEKFSPLLVDIITKAMSPNPDLRFQSAQEMLDAFLGLHENDPTWKNFQRNVKILRICISAFFILGCIMIFIGLKQMENEQARAAEIARLSEQAAKRAEEEARLSEEAAKRAEEEARLSKKTEQLAKEVLALVREGEDAYNRGDVSQAVTLLVKALMSDTPYKYEAQKLLTNVLGVYDLSDGLKAYRMVELPSEVLKVAISPEGTRLVVLYAFQIAIINTETGEILKELPAYPSATSDIVFFCEDAFLYAGENGITAVSAKNGNILWQNKLTTTIAISGSKKYAVGVNGSESYATIYEISTGKEVQAISFGKRSQKVPAGGGILADTNDNLLVLDEEGRFLASSFEDGGLILYDLHMDEQYEIFDISEYTHFEGGFHDHYFAFSAWNTSKCIFSIIDTDTMKQTGGFSAETPFFTKSDQRGIYVSSGNLLVEIDPVTGNQKEMAYVSSDILNFSRGWNNYTLVSAEDGTYTLFDSEANTLTAGQRDKGCEFLETAGSYVVLASRESPEVQILKLENHEDAMLCNYNPLFLHTEARFNVISNTMVFFRYDSFYILSLDGTVIAEVNIPDSSEVYDQQFYRKQDEAWLEVVYENGLVREYSATDGSLLQEYQGKETDKSLKETFETSRWRIVAPLHGTPVVYDKKTEMEYKQLEKNSYLTYVIETEDYLITQYISAKGEQYGLLLNQNLEVLAYLPDLCDVVEETLLFDDGIGHIRKSSIYSIEELIELAKEKES